MCMTTKPNPADGSNSVQIDDLQKREWESWKAWCEEFKNATGQEVNNKAHGKMVALIEKWGYDLLALRLEQGKYDLDVLNYEKANLFGNRLEKV